MPELTEIAGAVLRNDKGEYLLVQEGQGSARGRWNLAAGHVNEGERPRDTALRESPEETGYQVRLVIEEPLLIDKESDEGHALHAFLGEIVGGELDFPKDEIMNTGWFSVSATQKLHKDGALRTVWVLNAILKAEEYYAHYRD